MPEIKCPKCGTVFTPTANEYAELLKEVRDQEFQKELNMELQISKSKHEKEMLETSANHQAEINALKIKLAAMEKDKELALINASNDKDVVIKDLQNQLALNKSNYLNEINNLEKKHKILLEEKEELIGYYKDLKSKVSTKMLGETLEQHCENSFNQVRAMAFPNAYFEKDTLTPEGTKGDYIFKENTAEGAELLSIMFEMKNEGDTTATKHKNEDFFAKLDKDRNDKGCEFAVLVSLLEADNEYYNTGIVEVAPNKYPKMYVIRPQFFIPLISLLRNMALRNIDTRNELVAFKTREVDIASLDKEIVDFKEKFGKNIKTAQSKFQNALDEIEKSITHLQKIRDALLSSDNQLSYADAKLEALSTNKLLKNSPSLKEEYKNFKKEDK